MDMVVIHIQGEEKAKQDYLHSLERLKEARDEKDKYIQHINKVKADKNIAIRQCEVLVAEVEGLRQRYIQIVSNRPLEL